MSLGWYPTTAQFVIEAYPLGEVGEDDNETDGSDAEEALLVRMHAGTAWAFAKRTREMIGSGRSMRMCGQPVDPDGHTCTFPDA